MDPQLLIRRHESLPNFRGRVVFEETFFVPGAACPLDDHTTLWLIFHNYLHKIFLPCLGRRWEGAAHHHQDFVVRTLQTRSHHLCLYFIDYYFENVLHL